MSTVSLTARNTQTSIAITSTESSFTIVDNTGEAKDRILELAATVDWGISSATGAYGTKKPLAASTPFRFSTESSVLTFYIQAASTSGTLSVWVL